jgi:hypothetical protein
MTSRYTAILGNKEIFCRATVMTANILIWLLSFDNPNPPDGGRIQNPE